MNYFGELRKDISSSIYISAVFERIFLQTKMAQKYDEMNLNYKRTTTQEKGWSSESWDEFDKCDGNEILYDLNEDDTVMGQMFYEKWRKANRETMRLRSGTVDLMTNLRMFGKYFPCEIRLVEGAKPPTPRYGMT